jgi:tetratricopeptide (TPR) repeat protein
MSPAVVQQALRRGQDCEARGEFAAALTCYEEAVAYVRVLPQGEPEIRRLHGVVWMNCGNALQRAEGETRLASAVKAYDEAIALLGTLPLDARPDYRNHLGATWLNRGHALIAGGRIAEAIDSCRQAIAQLERLPIAADPNFCLNLAGAWTNLAHAYLTEHDRALAHLAESPEPARKAARTALGLLADVERAHPAFAEMSLRARRALVTAIGALLVGLPDPAELASEASDAIDDGLALAREWEVRDPNVSLRPLAVRLFRLGAYLYGTHQPHFLAEFVLENFAHPGFAADSEFQRVADETIAGALAAAVRPQVFDANEPASVRRLETVRTLREAQRQLARFNISSPSA